MKVLLASSEAVPYCKTGGLADAVGALARALAARGHEVRLCLPAYRGSSAAGAAPRKLAIPFAGGRAEIGLRTLRRDGLTAWLVDYPPFFDRPGIYGEEGRDYKDNDRRYALFCRAVLEAARAEDFSPDVIHAHDWQTGLICPLLKRVYGNDPMLARAGSVFTIHNMAYQGNFPREALSCSGLGPEEWGEDGVEFYGQASYLKAGLVYADRLSTVSPTYAREIQEPSGGRGFEGLLRRRASVLQGVLNGLDTESWDPSRDEALLRRYGPGDWAEGKAIGKAALQRELGLDIRDDRPLLGVVSRLDPQKGLDLVIAAVEPLLSRVQLAVLGSGDPALAGAFSALESRHPGAAAFRVRFDDELSRRIYAGSDLFLMPSRFEPCGLSQLIAMRYGAVPVAARTGGLSDTVFEETRDGREPNGFLCPPNDAPGFSAALGRALKAWRAPGWASRVRAGMGRDWSWGRAVEEYLGIYRQAMRAGTALR